MHAGRLRPSTDLSRPPPAVPTVHRAARRTPRVGSAASGSSGHACFGYRPRSSARTCGYPVRQNDSRSAVTAAGRPAGDSRCSSTGHPPVGQPRRRAPPEHLLQPDREHRLVARVVDAHARPARHRRAAPARARRAGAASGHGRSRRSAGRHVDAAQVRRRPRARSGPSQRVRSREQGVVGHVGPRRTERAVQEGQPLPQRAWRRRSSAAAPSPSRASPSRTAATHERRRPGRRAAPTTARSRRARGPGARRRARPATRRSSSSRSSAGAASIARSRSIGAADRIVASRRPAPRSASATASQPKPVSGGPRRQRRAGAGRHQVRRPAGPQAGDAVGVREGDDERRGQVVGRACRPRAPIGQRGQQPLDLGRASGRVCGPPRRSARSAATRSPPGARTSSESSATTSAARRAPDERGAPSSRARASRGSAGTADTARPRAVDGARPAPTAPSSRERRVRARPSPRRAAGRAARGRRRPGSPSTPARARTP